MKRLHGLVLGLVGLSGLVATPPVASWLTAPTERPSHLWLIKLPKPLSRH